MKLVISDNERELDVLSDANIRLLQDGLDLPVVARELTYAESADSDGRRRVRSKNQNAEGRIGLHISGTSDSHFWGNVDNVVELVESAHRNRGSIVYQPPGGTALAYDLEAITVTGLPQPGIELRRRRAEAEITFEAKPYGRLAATQLFSGGTLSGPIAGTTVQSVGGQVMAFGDLELTEASSQTRDFVEIGVQADFDPTNPEPLLLTAGTMAGAGGTLTVVTGTAGTASRPTGAYTTSGGNSYTIRTGLSTTPTACATTSARPHKGLWKIRARVRATADGARVRLSWRMGNGGLTQERWVQVGVGSRWVDLDLGTVDIPSIIGAQAFEARIEAASRSGYPNFDIDTVCLIPADRYLRLRGRVISETVSGLTAADDFSDHAAGTLNGKTPPITAGGNWTESGSGGNFRVVEGNYVNRFGVSESPDAGQFVSAGTAVASQIDVRALTNLGVPVNGTNSVGLFVRYVDANNFLLAKQSFGTETNQLVQLLFLIKKLSGTVTVLAATTVADFGYNRMSLQANSSGVITVQTGLPGDSFLTTRISFPGDASTQSGGTLASGKYGLYHENTSSTAAFGAFDDFTATVPSATSTIDQPAIFSGRKLQVTNEAALTASSDGAHLANTPVREGNYLLLPPATRNGQKSRIVVRARRDDIEDQFEDTGLTDNLTAKLSVTPRVLLK